MGAICRRALPSFLAVLKRFGPGTPVPLLPAGRLDAGPRLPVRTAGTARRCSTGSTSWSPAPAGRVYLAKDCPARPELLASDVPAAGRVASGVPTGRPRRDPGVGPLAASRDPRGERRLRPPAVGGRAGRHLGHRRSLIALLARERCRSLVLAGRDAAGLEPVAASLRRTVARVATVPFDADDVPRPRGRSTRCFDAAGEPVDLVVMAVGDLGHRRRTRTAPTRAARC